MRAGARYLLRVATVAVLLGPGCRQDDPRPTTPPPPGDPPASERSSREGERESEPPARDEPAVVFSTGEDAARVEVEVARTPGQIQRGLMYRKHLPPDRGMLFLMGEERIQSFWMKNTLIPLDMIFINDDMVVAGVVENAEPRTLTSRRIEEPSSYVLEVNAGWANKHGVKAGTEVRFEHLER